MTFHPTLFIGVGATSAFFTLRETYEHKTYIRGEGPSGGCVLNGVYQGSVVTEIRSFHHFNLSQDAAEAVEKAKEASERMGVPLSPDCTVESLQHEMREIKRASAEELERRRAQEEAWRAARAADDALRAARQIACAEEGVFPYGPYRGCLLEEAPRGYVAWLIKTDFSEGGNRVLQILSDIAYAHFQDYAFPCDPNKHIGEEGKRIALDVTVIRAHRFARPAYGAPWRDEVVQVTTMVDKATRACLVVFSASFAPAEGTELRIKATVKEHGWYKDQAQTVVQRVTVVEPKE